MGLPQNQFHVLPPSQLTCFGSPHKGSSINDVTFSDVIWMWGHLWTAPRQCISCNLMSYVTFFMLPFYSYPSLLLQSCSFQHLTFTNLQEGLQFLSSSTLCRIFYIIRQCILFKNNSRTPCQNYVQHIIHRSAQHRARHGGTVDEVNSLE